MQCQNPVESEVLNVVLAADIVPDRMDDTQLLQAIQHLVQAGPFVGEGANDLGVLHLQHKTSSGGNGGGSVSGTWETRNINYELENSIVNASSDIANSRFTLAQGVYMIDFEQQFYLTGVTHSRLQSITGDAVTINSTTGHGGSSGATSFTLGISGRVVHLTQETTFELQYLCANDRATNGLGVGTIGSGKPDIHMDCYVRRLA